MKSYETLTVGQIVTDKYGAANVLLLPRFHTVARSL